MKYKIAYLVIETLYFLLSLFFYYKILETIGANEILWLLYWLLIPMALALAILSALAEEED